ncbi:MAG: RNA-binding protein [Clostridia bacterium]|nr:RNA-binding protein [Clostridia bacterium]
MSDYMDVELILRHAKTPEEKLLGRRLMDLAQRCDRTGWYTSTDFLSPAEQAFCKLILPRLGIAYSFDGGYDGAERACLIFFPDYLEAPARDSEQYPISALHIAHPAPLTHRDFLGSVLGLGLERHAIGDILVGERETVMLATDSIMPFLLTNLSSVGRVGVAVEQVSPADITPPELKFEIIKDTVASLRFDSVVATAFRVSRETAQKAIRSGAVRLNHLEQLSVSANIAEGDILSFRGKGKAVLETVGNESRKGRIWIQVKRYI